MPLYSPALLDFTVWGQPVEQGNLSAFPVRDRHTGRMRCVVTHRNAQPLKRWRRAVGLAAERALGRQPLLDGALFIQMVFTFARPKSVSVARRLHPEVKPDPDKLVRAVFDAISARGYEADKLNVDGAWRQRYVGHPEALPRPGVRVVIRQILS